MPRKNITKTESLNKSLKVILKSCDGFWRFVILFLFEDWYFFLDRRHWLRESPFLLNCKAYSRFKSRPFWDKRDQIVSLICKWSTRIIGFLCSTQPKQPPTCMQKPHVKHCDDERLRLQPFSWSLVYALPGHDPPRLRGGTPLRVHRQDPTHLYCRQWAYKRRDGYTLGLHYIL